MIRTETNGIAARAIAARDGVPMIATLGTEWARQVNEAWQSTVDGILEAGRLLGHAKSDRELNGGRISDGIRRVLIRNYNQGLRTGKLDG